MIGKRDLKRVRLSLECSEDAKVAIEAHGRELGEWSIIGAVRKSVSRSAKFMVLERRGQLVLRTGDGVEEEVPRDQP